jgi:hypothetical protein
LETSVSALATLKNTSRFLKFHPIAVSYQLAFNLIINRSGKQSIPFDKNRQIILKTRADCKPLPFIYIQAE